MTELFREVIAEIKTGPSVFIHGPEFWLAFPFALFTVFIVIMIGGKKK